MAGETMELAVTSSLGAVGPVLGQLDLLLASEQRLPKGLRKDDLQALKKHLEEAKSSVIELSEGHPSSTEKCSMKEVRELSYDVEDYLDVVRHSSGGSWLSRLMLSTRIRRGLPLSGFLLSHLMLSTRIRRRLPLIASDISHLTSRFEDARQRRERFHLKPMSHAQPVHKLVSKQAEPEGHDKPVGKQGEIEEHEEPVNQQADHEDPDKPMNEIVIMLAFDTEQQLKVVPIFGSAGVGKTTLARRLYQYYGGRFHCRAFLRVSRKPDTKRLLASMLSQIKGRQPLGFCDVEALIDNIKQHLQGKSYLIVVDDLWATSVWDVISRAFPEGNCYSRIITTTEIEDIALACCSYPSKCIYNMRPLSDNQSGQLFLGNSEWVKEDINQKYNDLKDHLKICLLYLNMYPEDYVVRKDDLVKQWVAEGFIDAVEGKSREEIAGSHFDELVTKGMIQTVDTNYSDKVLSCTVDHMVLDFIAQRSMEENFITVVDYPETVIALPDKVRRLSVKFGGAKSAQVPGNFRISQVRSLMFSGFFKCVPSIVEYWLLRVLILHVWNDHDKSTLDLAIIGELFQLRYLKIECNMTVKLPAMIGRLQYLQTLEVDAKVAAIPSEIFLLQNLLHLRFPKETYIPRTRRIGRMTSLLSLGNFNLSTCTSSTVRELRKLTNVQALHLTSSAVSSYRLVRNMRCLASILGKLSSLKSLIMDGGASSGMSITCDALSRDSPHPALLERLELSPRIFIMPDLSWWIQKNLCTLKIAVRKLSTDNVDDLKKLTALAALRLYVRTTPEERVIFNDGFKVLKYFKFICTAPCVEFTEGAMPTVRSLKLGFNANTMQQYKPEDAGIEHLKGLEVISAKIGGASADQASREAAKRRLLDAFSKHPSLRCVKEKHQRSVCVKEKHPRPLIINVQLVDWSFYGDTEQSSADVITRGGPDEQYGIGENDLTEDTNILADSGVILSPESSSHLQNPGWKSWRPRNGVRLAETARGLSYVMRQHTRQAGFRAKNEVASIKLEMELMAAKIDSSAGALPEEWVLKLQDLVYDIEDFIDIYSRLRITRSRRQALAHMSHIVHLKGRIRSLREWQHGGISSHGGGCSAAALSGSSSTSPYAPEDVLVGIEQPKSELLGLVLNPEQFKKAEQLRVISIVGYRGIGKTALARAVYYDARHSFDCVAWVVASKCSHGGDLLNKINQQVKEEARETVPDFYKLIERIQKILQYKRVLVVVDDLQRAEVWYDIQSAFAGSLTGSRIIVTTSIQSVAAACSTDSNIYRMRGLGQDECEWLFWGRVHSRANRTPALEYSVEDNLRKCGGLPLALISVANYVKRKGPNLPLGAPGAFEEMNRVLTQCYDSLPDNGHRTCLLSLSTFPQGHLIKRKSLIRRWIAEGLAVGDDELSAEQVAGNRFDELIDRNIVEPVLIGNNSKVKGCLLLGVIMDFIIKKSVSTEFATLICKDEPLLPNKKGACPVRRLSVHGGTTRSGRVAKGIGLDHVRLLTICNTVPFDFQGCWLLRVLDLEGCEGVDKRILRNICKLAFLKYLSLRRSDVYRIPKKIKKLECLETLDIRETRVEALPIEVFMLPRLAHLFGQFELPQELRDGATRSKLQTFFSEKSRLQTLSGFVMVENNGFELIMLHMRSLRKVKIRCKYSVTSHSERLLASSLQKRFSRNNALESLSIDFGNESMNFLNYIEPPCVLSSIKLQGRLRSLPSFITSHDTTLSELQLSSTGLSVEALSLLQNLRRLLYLKLVEDRDGFWGDCFVVRSGGFPSLLRLCFEAPKLPQVYIHEGGMSSLSSLHLLCPEFATYNNFKGNDPAKHFKGVDSGQKLKGIIDLGKSFKETNSGKIFQGIEHLKYLNEVLLHPSVGLEELDAWKKEARRHINRPKVSMRLMA